jgi:hypothetical protein
MLSWSHFKHNVAFKQCRCVLEVFVVLTAVLQQCQAGLLNGINVGLTIPAMELSLPSPALPHIKLKTIVIKPPKQSLRSLLPRFTYNVPTFSDDTYEHPGMYAASALSPSIAKQTSVLSSVSSENHHHPIVNYDGKDLDKEMASTVSMRSKQIQLGQFAKLPNPYMTADELQARFALSPGHYYRSQYA